MDCREDTVKFSGLFYTHLIEIQFIDCNINSKGTGNGKHFSSCFCFTAVEFKLTQVSNTYIYIKY
jgi:hypothetical protein